MSRSMITVNSLSKRYRIGAAQAPYKTLRESIVAGVSTPFRNLSRLRNLTRFKNGEDAEAIWALRDVSFEVNKGEVLGIIGRNGSGKSTLLKVLTRITDPTSGSAEIRGRVSSLLEVGTGFHPELTGRENIFLNGSLLGMRKREIEAKFDQIVSFAEIEKFLDTPVKRYSSGMYVRLAFAVAAHLDPEIMLVDEVLAVGDIAFQKKCLGAMGEVARGGRTVLFVSHNMGAIRSLCSSALWLDAGQLVEKGPVNEIAAHYEHRLTNRLNEGLWRSERAAVEVGNRPFYVRAVDMLDRDGKPCTTFKYGDSLALVVHYCGEPASPSFSPEFRIFNEFGQMVCVGAAGAHHSKYFKKQVGAVRIEIGPLTLTSGKYRVQLDIMTGDIRADTWDDAIAFSITECQPFVTHWEMVTSSEGVCILQHSFSEVV